MNKYIQRMNSIAMIFFRITEKNTNINRDKFADMCLKLHKSLAVYGYVQYKLGSSRVLFSGLINYV